MSNDLNILKLHDDFIKESDVFLKVFSDWFNQFAWTSSCFPVYFWKDILYVLCKDEINVVKDFATKKNIRIVFLTASEQLKLQLWEKAKSAASSATQTTATTTEAALQKEIKTTEEAPKLAVAISANPILTSIEKSISSSNTLGKKLIEIITPEFAKEHLDKLKTYYDKSLILIQYNGFATPIAVTENINLQNVVKAQITTQVPNPFYVSYKTKKPFHGYLVANDHTKNFIKNFLDEKELIENLTIIPLTMEDEVIGYQVSMGQKSSFCDEALQHSLVTAQGLMAEVVALIDSKKSA